MLILKLTLNDITMFEKLYLLVKSHAQGAIFNNPLISGHHHEAIVIEASSTIIEVLKGQMENGKVDDLINFFQLANFDYNSVTKKVVNKFANKLNNYYNIDASKALIIANNLIQPVMVELIKQSKNSQNKEFLLSNMLTKLNGNKADLSGLVKRLSVA